MRVQTWDIWYVRGNALYFKINVLSLYIAETKSNNGKLASGTWNPKPNLKKKALIPTWDNKFIAAQELA